MTDTRILRHIRFWATPLVGALALARASSAGMISNAIASGVSAIGNAGESVVSAKRTGDRRHQYDWMTKNDAAMEIADPYWQMANAKAKEILARKPLPIPRPIHFYGGNPKQKLIALTFDDGPHAEATNLLLTTLKQLNVKATFFVVGKQVRKFPNLLRNIHASGHQIENHSFSHPTLTKLSLEDAMTEYLACSLIIRDTIGITPTYCRPPGGKCSKQTFLAAALTQMKTSMWTNDPLDYAFPGPDTLLSRMKRGFVPGAVYLLHSGAKDTPAILPRFVEEARKEGYRFVTIDEMYKSWSTNGSATLAKKR